MLILTLCLLMSGKYAEYIVGVWGRAVPGGVSVGLGGGMSRAGDYKVIALGNTSAASMEIPIL